MQQKKSTRSKPVKKRSRKYLFILIIFVLLVAGTSAAGFYSYVRKLPANLWEKLIPVPEGDTVSVVIEPGMTASQAARAFEVHGALTRGSPAQLARWMMKFGIDKRIRAGHYAVVPSDPWNLARQLRTVKPALLKAQILPGLDIFAMIDSLESQDKKLNRENISLALMNNKNYPAGLLAVLKELPEDEYTRAAFLMPETYMLVDRSADELISTASGAWWATWSDLIARHSLTAKDIQDASVIASMVEREVLYDSEAKRVAGVIHNRLRLNMLLQIDATVVYAWRLKGRKVTRVLNKDLEVESPYNTYRVKGLPPRPICVPGMAAWEAAFDPEDNDYLYYVADKRGFHQFSKTYNDHVKSIRQIRSEK